MVFVHFQALKEIIISYNIVILSVSMLKLLGKTLIPLVHLILSIVMMLIKRGLYGKVISRKSLTNIKHAPLKIRRLGKTRAPWINKTT
jgi:hypothetical protein